MPTLPVAVCQLRPDGRLPEEALARLRATRPGLIVLPEYFWVRSEDEGPAAAAAHAPGDLARLAELSGELDGVWVGGTLLEQDSAGRIYNRCPVFDRGREVARYGKRRLMPGESAAGLSAGSEAVVVEVRGVRLGLLICADVLHEDSYASLRHAARRSSRCRRIRPFVPRIPRRTRIRGTGTSSRRAPA